MPLFNSNYKVFQPDSNGDFRSEWYNCLNKMAKLTDNENIRIFRINVFLRSSDIKLYRENKQFVKRSLINLFGDKCPTFGIVSQSPENSFEVTIEAGFIDSTHVLVIYRKYKDFHYTVILNNTCKALWANGIETEETGLDMEMYSNKAFENSLEILKAENMSFDNIVRQWNYIGDILHVYSDSQHYQVFNEVRNIWYSQHRTKNRKFPAATGIGMNFKGMCIDFCAIIPSGDIKIVSINNPIQIDPWSYNQEVLVGPDGNTKTPPQFERAKILANHEKSVIFVSGTASIIGQKTVGGDDVQKQTKTTIENIENLVSKENLLCHYIETHPHNPKFYRYIRVYVKRSADIPLVKKICKRHYGNIPANYVQADICREDLLVEIEAEI